MNHFSFIGRSDDGRTIDIREDILLGTGLVYGGDYGPVLDADHHGHAVVHIDQSFLHAFFLHPIYGIPQLLDVVRSKFYPTLLDPRLGMRRKAYPVFLLRQDAMKR